MCLYALRSLSKAADSRACKDKIQKNGDRGCKFKASEQVARREPFSRPIPTSLKRISPALRRLSRNIGGHAARASCLWRSHRRPRGSQDFLRDWACVLLNREGARIRRRPWIESSGCGQSPAAVEEIKTPASAFLQEVASERLYQLHGRAREDRVARQAA